MKITRKHFNIKKKNFSPPSIHTQLHTEDTISDPTSDDVTNCLAFVHQSDALERQALEIEERERRAPQHVGKAPELGRSSKGEVEVGKASFTIGLVSLSASSSPSCPSAENIKGNLPSELSHIKGQFKARKQMLVCTICSGNSVMQ